jgi:hypothetical protein
MYLRELSPACPYRNCRPGPAIRQADGPHKIESTKEVCVNSKIDKNSIFAVAVMSVLWAVSVILFALPAAAQIAEKEEVSSVVAAQPAVEAAAPAPFIDDVSGVSVGMTADEVKDKLGKPESSDASSMYYELDGSKTLRLRLDADKKVSLIAAMYMGNDANPPKVTDVFGPDVNIEPGENGSVYKMVRYPSAGFWVAYSRLNAGGDPLTTITIQKLRN